MEQPSTSNGTGPSVDPRTARRRGGRPWSEEETARLREIIAAHPLPRKPRAEDWARIAVELAASGFDLRSCDSLCHRCLALKLYTPSRTVRSVAVVAEPQERRPQAPKPKPVTQASFDAVAVRLALADALEDVVKRLRGEEPR